MKERQTRVQTNFPKEKYTSLMAESLPTLRMRLGINQDELAELIGSSRQMLSLIERKIRPMMWDTFMSIMYVFRSNDETRNMMVFMGLYTDELVNFLNISGSGRENSVNKVAAFGGKKEELSDLDYNIQQELSDLDYDIQQKTKEAIEKALKEISKK